MLSVLSIKKEKKVNKYLNINFVVGYGHFLLYSTTMEKLTNKETKKLTIRQTNQEPKRRTDKKRGRLQH